MRWGDLRRSGNIEDRRGQGGGFGGGGGGGFRGGGLGIGGLIIVGLLAWATGIDPRIILGGIEMVQGPNGGSQVQEGKQGAPADATGTGGFVSAVLGSTEDVWKQIFQQNGQTYEEPRLVLFSDQTGSACGLGQAAMGPFYCPPDQRVYLDTAFFKEMEQRFHSPGDFASAYVIAHEVGHHVQNLMGIMDKVQQERERSSRSESNALSVRTELQADCFAGVWAHHAKQSLDAGDIEEALNAATAIGDDNIQREQQGRVAPDKFTHGSSAQRVKWFKTGFESGQVRDCNTFSAKDL